MLFSVMLLKIQFKLPERREGAFIISKNLFYTKYSIVKIQVLFFFLKDEKIVILIK